MGDKHAIIGIDPWLETPAGRYLLDWEQARLDAMVADIFGFHAVQLGWPQVDGLRHNRMPHRWFADDHAPAPGDPVLPLRQAAVLTDFDELPFSTASMDLVLLPHTVRGHEELLSSLDGRFTLFGRDEVTLQHLVAHAGASQWDIAPDMALGIDVERLQRRVALLPWWWTWGWMGLRRSRRARYRRWQRSSELIQPDTDGHLAVFRSDQEAAHQRGPAEQDLSGLYHSAMRDRDECDAVTSRFLHIIDRASSVSTDRLHVAIGANALHKPACLFDNNYGKNHSVMRAFPALSPYVSLGSSPSTRHAPR